MKVLLYGRYGSHPQDIEPLVRQFGFEIVDSSASPRMTTTDAVITFGGDGTLIGAERDYPGVPKLPLRDSVGCFKCHPNSNEELLQLLSENKLVSVEYPKLEVEFEGQKFLVVNDVTIRNTLPNTALRFSVTTSYQLPTMNSLIGDGLVVSTSFGSSGYFFSIAKRTFDEGYGIAFNNLHNQDLRPIYAKELNLEVKIIRGPGSLAMDNNPQIFELSDNEIIKITNSEEATKILSP